MEPSGRLWLVAALAILAAAGAASVWMAAGGTQAPPVAATQPAEPKPAAASVPAPSPAAVATPAPAPAPPPASLPAPIIVDSAERGYPLTAWQIGQTAGGWIDAPAFGSEPLDDRSIVEISGWAGDSETGWRALRVAIAICGTVVATVRADLPRPEVARAAHPNLGRSGWRAKLAIAHVPRCDGARIQAVAQIGASRAALPLLGERPIRLAPTGGTRPALLAQPSPALPPEDDPQTRVIRLSGNTNVRRCGDLQCEIRGRLPAGAHRAVVGEDTAGWLLVAVPASNVTGWISKQAVAGLPPAARR
ncbi:MAG: SH3 domain-containing protein [Rhodospirillales bacterium]|nr:SH3 domain-containing protein [Rhodospirillales bacterium]